MATVGQALTTPESGWRRVNADHPLISYQGTWITQTNAAYSGGINKYSNSVGDKITFTFKGTKLRIIGQYNTTSKTPASISIDGVVEQITFPVNVLTNSALTYEKINMSDTIHTVVITINAVGEYQSLQGIDIDSSGRLFHPNEVTDIKDLVVGKRIRCNYYASSGSVGSFTNIGQETANFIPVTSSATPNGDFYFIMVESINKKKILIADRNIQHTISWDTLNTAGIVSGIELGFNNPINTSNIVSFRLPTGGTSSTDKNSEWDKYIVNSTLDGTITAGDNNVWNWGVFSWTSTTTTGTGRVRRGQNTSGGFSESPTNTSSTAIGFRPVIEIKNTSQTKVLFLSNGEYKKWEIGNPAEYDVGINNIIPIMTSNTAPSGVAFASTEYQPTWLAYKAFNGTTVNNDDTWLSTSATLPQWIGYDFGTRKVINKYSITIQNKTVVPNGVQRAPKNWTFEGSNDGSVWDVLDTQSNITDWTYSTPKTFIITNNLAFKMYRIHVTANNGATDYVAIGDIQMFERILKNPAKPSSWVTVSVTLPDSNAFIDNGMDDDLSVLNRKSTTFTTPMDDNSLSGEILGNGKVFKEKIDLNKYIDIENINVK